MKIACVGTGSSGNMFYVEGQNGTGIYLDAGVPPSHVQRMGLSLANKPVFVTHEHGDHGRFAKTLQDRYGCDVYCSAGTAGALKLDRFNEVDPLFLPGNDIAVRQTSLVAGLTDCWAFPVVHTAEEPVGFYIHLDGERLIYLADAGSPPFLWDMPLDPHVMILESNYTEKRLEEAANRSFSSLFVAGRVSSGVGHLSARETYTFAKPFLDKCQLILLFHQSGNNFDYEEYRTDGFISEDYKDLAVFAVAGEGWDTVPF